MKNKQIIIEDCPYFIGGNCQEYLDGVCENHKCDLKIIRELEEKLSNKRKECDELHETVKSQKEEIKNLNYTLYEERNLTTDLAKANLRISTLERDLSSVRNRFKNENQQNKEIIKAKEQECEELKELCNGLDTTIDNYTNLIELRNQQLDQLKAQLLDQEAETLKAGGIIETLTKENEELKKQACGLRPKLKYIIDKTCSKYNINAKYYHEKIVEIINNLDKLKQTLTEIKEIAEKIDDSGGCAYGDYDCDNCSSLEQETVCTYKVKKLILQKISECEVEDEI